MTYGFFKQLPMPSPTKVMDLISELNPTEKCSWLRDHIMELLYTANSMSSFAADFGYNTKPYFWNPERRSHIRAEFDAAVFHLYLGSQEDWNSVASKELREWFPTPRDVMPHIMDSFPIVRDKDLKEYGQYRTCEAILAEYDRMATAIATGVSYESTLSSKPGQQSETVQTLEGMTISRSKVYIAFVLDLFTVRPEIDRNTLSRFRSFVNNVFTEPEKILAFSVSPKDEVRRHIDEVNALVRQGGTDNFDGIIKALTHDGAISEGVGYNHGPRFDMSRAEHAPVECISRLVQEFLRIEARGAQWTGSGKLLDSSEFAQDEDVASPVQNEQAENSVSDELSIKG